MQKFVKFPVVLLLTSISAFALTPQEIARKAFGSTVLLIMQDENGQPLQLGSGFYISQGIIATNCHVIEGASGGIAKLIGKDQKIRLEGVIAANPSVDLALLKTTPVAVAPLILGDAKKLEIGQRIYAVGNPRGLEGTFSQGIVSNIRKIGSDSIVQMTTPISPGSSGGPVLDENGKVVGVSVATYNGGQNLNFAIPSNYVVSLYKTRGSVRPFITQKKGTARNSILSSLGKPNTTGVSLNNFLWSNDYGFSTESSFTIRNNLRESVSNISGMLIFYDQNGKPVHFHPFRIRKVIPAGLAIRERISSTTFDESVKQLSTDSFLKRGIGTAYQRTPRNLEWRILYFDIIKGDSGLKLLGL